jgi:hypothetical protein
MMVTALGAAPALAHGGKYRHAHKKEAPEYVYTATINCGRGPVTVVSEEDLYAPLVDLKRNKQYLPIAWDVEVDGHPAVQDEKDVPKIIKRLARKCSYTDGVATGTVTVLGPLPMRR